MTLSWLTLRGAFNKERFINKKQRIKFNPRYAAFAGVILGSAIVLESLYLLSMDYYLESKIEGTADLRNDYSKVKGQYLGDLDKYGNYGKIISSKSNAAEIPQLLNQFSGKNDIRIDRMDYLQGEVRIGGISGYIELFMTYLSGHPQVKGLEFMSPLTPDKSGKDRFLIRFDFING